MEQRINVFIDNIIPYDATGNHAMSVIKSCGDVGFDVTVYYIKGIVTMRHPRASFQKVAPIHSGWKFRLSLIKKIYSLINTLILLCSNANKMAINNIKKHIKENDINIFIYAGFSIFLPLLTFFDKTFNVIDFHGLTPIELIKSENGKKAISRAVKQLHIFQYADDVIVHSHYIAKELREKYQLKQNSITKMPLFIQELQTDKLDSKTAKANEIILLTVGRVIYHKRIDLIIKALSFLYKENISFPDIFLHVVGRAEHDGYLDFCKNLAKQLKLANKVFFTGVIDNNQLRILYQKAALYVCASHHEGFCVPLVEAMKHKLLIVASDVGAILEITQGAAILFQDGNGQALADAIKFALKLPREEKEKRQVLADEILQKYKSDNIRNDYINYLNNIFYVKRI